MYGYKHIIQYSHVKIEIADLRIFHCGRRCSFLLKASGQPTSHLLNSLQNIHDNTVAGIL